MGVGNHRVDRVEQLRLRTERKRPAFGDSWRETTPGPLGSSFRKVVVHSGIALVMFVLLLNRVK